MRTKIHTQITVISLVILSFLAAGCIKDTGKYDYREVNSVTIRGIADRYAAPLGGRLTIKPVLLFSDPDSNDEWQYRWYVLNTNATSGKNTAMNAPISTQRDLDILVDATSQITIDGDYHIAYCVTNLTTGVRYDSWFTLIVRNRQQTGYIMLCERENDSFDIDLISIYNDTLTQYHNMLDANLSELPRTGCKVFDMVCYRDPFSPSLTYSSKERFAIWILSDQRTERVAIDNFSWQPEFNISSISTILDKYLNITDEDGNVTGRKKLVAEKLYSMASYYNKGRSHNWMYFENNWYWYNTPVIGYYYLQPVNAASVTAEPYKAAPFICGSTEAAILFNEDEKRFEFQSINPLGGSSQCLKTTPCESKWKPGEYSLIYMTNRTDANNPNGNQGFAIVKEGDKYKLILIAIAAPPAIRGEYDFPANFNPEIVKHFALHNSSNYLFCVVPENPNDPNSKEKLIRLHLIRMDSIDVTDKVLPPGHRFSLVKNSAVRMPASRLNMLIVCTYDPNGEPGQNGQMAFYEVNTTSGELTLAKHPANPTGFGYQIDMKWGGFGKVINVEYKEQPSN